MTKADLERNLQNEGFSNREASRLVDAVFDSIKDALVADDVVDLPIGRFEVVSHTRTPLRGWFLNKVRTTYKRRKYVRFTSRS